MEFLARQQRGEGYIHSEGPRVAVTGLAVMAFLAAGHTPDVGPYGLTVRRAVDWLVAQAPADGYFGQVDGSRMYGHGIVTLALAEAYGVEPDGARRRRMREVLASSLKVILDAQRVDKADVHRGGWRYEPNSPDSDLSLSGWNALALRAARDAGLDVPDEAVGGAVAYVLRCFRAEASGGFAYQPGIEPSIGMTGVGVLSLHLLSAGGGGASAVAAPATQPALSGPRRAGATFLAGKPVGPGTPFPYYSHYYATQAAFQAGGATWDAVWANATDRLLPAQQPDGGWPASPTPQEPDRAYATAMAVLTLSVPYQLLPVYQR